MPILDKEKIIKIESLIRNIQEKQDEEKNKYKDVENYIDSSHAGNFLLEIKKLIKRYEIKDMYKTNKALIYYDRLKDMDYLEATNLIDSLELYLFFKKIGWISKKQDLLEFISIYKRFRKSSN